MSSASGFILFALVVFVTSALVVTGVVLVFRARRAGPGHPACGACGYDVTGSIETGRCPECGRLFAEVGVRAAMQRRRSGLLGMGVAAILVGVLLMIGVALSSFAMARARAARAEAMAARAQAVAAQANAVAAAQAAQAARARGASPPAEAAPAASPREAPGDGE